MLMSLVRFCFISKGTKKYNQESAIASFKSIHPSSDMLLNHQCVLLVKKSDSLLELISKRTGWVQ